VLCVVNAYDTVVISTFDTHTHTHTHTMTVTHACVNW